jgi:glycosyltransferase involved in cell wall biosynthesis
LDSVDESRRRFHLGSEAVEVIIADNVSTDQTARIACQRGCRVVTVQKRNIAAVRNGGARDALGQILSFVDADSLLHPETFNAIDRVLGTDRVVGGSTGVNVERMSLGIGLTYAFFVPMVWVTKMDTGVVFCRRRDFETVGGYNEGMSFAEDVRFLLDLRRLGRKRKQTLARVRSAKATASTRKFDRYGDWHYLIGMFRAVYWYLLSPRAGREFARAYWYGDVR